MSIAQAPVHEEESAMSFGSRLRELREAKGYSVRGLGKACGVSGPHISRVETGERDADGLGAVTFDKLVHELGTTHEYLLHGTGPLVPITTLDESKDRYPNRARAAFCARMLGMSEVAIKAVESRPFKGAERLSAVDFFREMQIEDSTGGHAFAGATDYEEPPPPPIMRKGK